MVQVDSLKTGKKFKKTEIGEIPVDWEVTELSDVISSYKNGIWGDDPTLNEKSYPIIRSTEITHDGKIDLSTVAFRKISETQIKKYKLHDNDILLVASSGSPNLIGRSALFEQPYDKRIYLFSNFMIRIRPKKINYYFLFYFLNSQYYHNFLKFLQQTSTGLRNLPKREFIKMKLPFPSLHEQKKIAEILTTVDQTIEKSDQVIEKTKELKKGLMQQLLTRGIGHTKFKKTKIGEIPVDWKIKQISEVVGKIIDNRGKTPPLVDKGYELIEVNAIERDNKFPDYDNVVKFVDTETYQNWFRDGHPAIGDVLIPTVGTIGVTAIMNENRGCIAQNIIAVRAGTNMNPEYFYYFTNSSLFLIQIHRVVMSAVQPSLRVPHFLDFFISVPPQPEQKKIAEILTSIDEQIEKENANKEKLEMLKKGLMQVLLTGKIRVEA